PLPPRRSSGAAPPVSKSARWRALPDLSGWRTGARRATAWGARNEGGGPAVAPTRMPKALRLLVALIAPAAFAEATPALQTRVLSELNRPQAVADLYRLYERREEKGDLSSLIGTLEAAARSPGARPDVRALAQEIRAQLAISQGQLPQAKTLFD